MGLFKKDKAEKKARKNDGSDKSWGEIFRDMPKTPSTRDMAQGTADAASFMKNLAAKGDQGRLRSTGLKGTAVIHQIRDTGGRVGVNPVMQLELLVHVDALQNAAVLIQRAAEISRAVEHRRDRDRPRDRSRCARVGRHPQHEIAAERKAGQIQS